MPSSPQKQHQSLCVLVPGWAATLLPEGEFWKGRLGPGSSGLPSITQYRVWPPTHTALPTLPPRDRRAGPLPPTNTHGLSWVALREDGWCSQSASYRPGLWACLAALWT